jgi:hypothetical protein
LFSLLKRYIITLIADEGVPVMDVLKALKVVSTLFSTTCVFCWVLTSHWIFGPMFTTVFFLGGILGISLLGVSIMEE